MNERLAALPIEPGHEGALGALLRRIEVFTPDEVACALEVFTCAAESGNREYVGLAAWTDAGIVGVIETARLPDFYRPGDDPVIYTKRL